MNINAINSTIKSIQKISFKSSNNHTVSSNKLVADEFVSEQNTPQKKKKKKNIWTYVAQGALILALVTDIAVEHKIRVEEKAKKEAIQKEKELAEKLKKEAEEKAKKLVEEIKKQKEAIEKANKSGKSGSVPDVPDINFEPPKS